MLTAAIDNWYAEAIVSGVNNGLRCGDATPGAASIDQLIASRCSPWLRPLMRFGAGRGLLWFLAVRGVDRVICTISSRGVLVFLLLEALFGWRKRVFLVEYLRPEPDSWKERIKERLVFGPLFRRALLGMQVMTHWEVASYARRFRLPQERIHFVTFPMMLRPGQLPPPGNDSEPVVMSSGRAACDWPTLFAAARGASWRLLVVCARGERAQVDQLNSDGRATVMSEIPAAEHQRLLLSSTVYALVLREISASSGQVRLARTIEAGVPVVASAVRGLDGYLEAGVTGVAVPVADAAALRTAIDGLVADHQARQALRLRAYEAMRPRTLEQFVATIKQLSLAPSA